MSEREKLIEAMARAIILARYGGAEEGDDDATWIRAHWQEAADALAAIEAHGGGCRVVPVEATPSMFRRVSGQGGMQAAAYARAAWPDMLAASPYAPQEASDDR